MLYFLLFSVAFCTSWSDCRFSFSQTFGLQDCEYICNYRFCFKCLNWILPHVFLSFSVGVQVYLIFWNIFNILNVLCVFLLCRLSSLLFDTLFVLDFLLRQTLCKVAFLTHNAYAHTDAQHEHCSLWNQNDSPDRLTWWIECLFLVMSWL